MATHKKQPVNPDIPYEANTISLSGIIYFSVGLFLLIVVTFVLMLVLQGYMEDYAVVEKKTTNPLALSKQDALPPEPRLQAAPGFGVETKTGFKKFELMAPQSEYWELEKQWAELLEKGEIDEKTGTVISLPIAEAKKRLLARSEKGPESATFNESLLMMSDSSAGRTATARIR